jgi:hypothetical protein
MAAASYVSPLAWAVKRESGEVEMLHNGTAFFMRIAGPTVLVTAAHVVRQLQSDSTTHGRAMSIQLMSVPFNPLDAIVDIDDERDLATIAVDATIPERLKRWVYQRAIAQWPPPPPDTGKGIFFLGFPSVYRKEAEPRHHEFGTYGGLLTATSIAEDRIVAQLEHDELEVIPGFTLPPRNEFLGGMSGAPAWALTSVGWRLAGVLYEYSTDYELFYFRRPDCLAADGTIVRR